MPLFKHTSILNKSKISSRKYQTMQIIETRQRDLSPSLQNITALKIMNNKVSNNEVSIDETHSANQVTTCFGLQQIQSPFPEKERDSDRVTDTYE